MRIIAGEWRGRALTPVGKGDPRAHLRPTTDRTRESLFNMLAGGRFGDPFSDATVLDLFAGTGALGFEALSRGAQGCTFVDDGRKAQSLLRDNIRLLDCADRARLIARDAARLGPAETPARLVVLEPPYGNARGERALDAARAGGGLGRGALIVWEENAPQTAPEGFAPRDSRRYGDTHVTVLTAL